MVSHILHKILIYVSILGSENNTIETCCNESMTIIYLRPNTTMPLDCAQATLRETPEENATWITLNVETKFSPSNTFEATRDVLLKQIPACRNDTFVENSGIFSSPKHSNSGPNTGKCGFLVNPWQGNDTNLLKLQFECCQSQSDLSDSLLQNWLCTTNLVQILSEDGVGQICDNWTTGKHFLVFTSSLASQCFRFVTDSKMARLTVLAKWEKVKSNEGTCTSVLETQTAKFEINHTPQTWFDSDFDCRSRGGQLAVIDDAATHELIEFHLQVSHSIDTDCKMPDAFWIGANDLLNESDYVWSGGGKVAFSRWFPGWAGHDNYGRQPSDDGLSREDCVEMRRLFPLPLSGSDVTEYFWNDRSCTEKNAYLCRQDKTANPLVNQSSGLHVNHSESCQSSPCHNNGHCRQLDNVSATCQCPPQYTGTFCELSMCSLCDHGLCEETSLGSLCTCYEGYWGINCELDEPSCARSICSDRGRCLPGNTSQPACLCSRQRTGPMCSETVDWGHHETTLGQRMLKEPIWIGLIVIVVVVVLIGVLYVVRNKCGRYFTCCEVVSSKDDNILNSHGTITLNSFPLRQLRRPSGMFIVSASSPSYTESNTPANHSANFSPGIKIWNAAAKFFASYKDTERSLVSAPLTTDFTRTTDTSLSQDTGDSSVGALVGGTLQLDLHIRENQEYEKTARARTDRPWRDKSSTVISQQPITSVGILMSDSTAVNAMSQPSFNGGTYRNQLLRKDFDHIYPQVIVQSESVDNRCQALSCYGNDGNDINNRNDLNDSPNMEDYFANSSGAYLTEVDLDPDLGICCSKTYEVCGMSTWWEDDMSTDSTHRLNQTYHSSELGDSIHRLDQTYHSSELGDSIHRLDQTYHSSELGDSIHQFDQTYHSSELGDSIHQLDQTYHSSELGDSTHRLDQTCHSSELGDSIHRFDQTYHSSKLDSDSDEVGQLDWCDGQFTPLRMQKCANMIIYNELTMNDVGVRSLSSMPYLDTSDANSNPRTHTGSDDNSVSDISVRTTNFPPQAQFLHDSFRTQFDADGNPCNRVPCDVYHVGKLSRDCLANRSETKSSVSPENENVSRHKLTKKSYKKSLYGRKHKQTFAKQSPSARSEISVKDHRQSNTDSELFRTSSKQRKGFTNVRSPNDERHKYQDLHSPQTVSKSVRATKTSISDSRSNNVGFGRATKTSISDAGSKDLFRKVFSQEIDLDDLSLTEIDDPDMEFRVSLNSEQSFLESETHFPENDKCSGILARVAGSGDQLKLDTTASSASSGTPTTCNVIMYDSNGSRTNNYTTPIIKSHLCLTRKHSSLDLVEAPTQPHPRKLYIRGASSMHELYYIPSKENDKDVQSRSSKSGTSLHYQLEIQPTRTISDVDVYRDVQVASVRPVGSNVDITVDDYVENNSWIHDRRNDCESFFSSPENLSPHTRSTTRKSTQTDLNYGSTNYLSVTDTDSAMSSAPSPQATPNACPSGQGGDQRGVDQVVKDSAYQTKQSSVETETMTDHRIRRQILPLREEDRRVTQRLHQAAVKLLIMQQRLRRARQNMSKDSAVNTISEDEIAVDNNFITSRQNMGKESAVNTISEDDVAVNTISEGEIAVNTVSEDDVPVDNNFITSRQNMSKESAVNTLSEGEIAVNTISEGEVAVDHNFLTSRSRYRTSKNGVVYQVSRVDEVAELFPLQCSKIVEEHLVVSYEV